MTLDESLATVTRLPRGCGAAVDVVILKASSLRLPVHSILSSADIAPAITPRVEMPYLAHGNEMSGWKQRIVITKHRLLMSSATSPPNAGLGILSVSPFPLVTGLEQVYLLTVLESGATKLYVARRGVDHDMNDANKERLEQQ